MQVGCEAWPGVVLELGNALLNLVALIVLGQVVRLQVRNGR